eukprot:gene26002-11693_t
MSSRDVPRQIAPRAADANIDPSNSERRCLQERLLYVDGLNYLTSYFFPLHMPWWEVPQKILQRVASFVQAARNGGWTLVVFLDASHPTTTEAQNKWRNRRAKEVAKQFKNVPLGTTLMLGEAFRRSGVEVRYSYVADNDDTLAYWAHQNGASVLSSDKDFFRYTGADFKVYKDFSHQRAKAGRSLDLLEGIPNPKKSCLQRPVLMSPPPETRDKDPSFVCLKASPQPHYIRGVTSALVRRLGVNQHLTVRPLRQALYARLGMTADVLEEFPEWDTAEGGSVVWVQESVSPNPALDHLLDRPKEAVATLFPKLQTIPSTFNRHEWNNHVFACHALVYELCSAFGDQSFLTLLLSAAGTWAAGQGGHGSVGQGGHGSAGQGGRRQGGGGQGGRR